MGYCGGGVRSVHFDNDGCAMKKEQKPERKPKPVLAPESTLTALCDGGTVHREDGSDPWPCVCVAEAG